MGHLCQGILVLMVLTSCVGEMAGRGNLRQSPLAIEKGKDSFVESPQASTPSGSLPSLSAVQSALVNAAQSNLGQERLLIDGKSFALDCSGVTSAFYWDVGINLAEAYPGREGSGVDRLHQYLAEKGLLYKPDEPVPGDLIFWDDTYDKNGNGLVDDELTHIGMVVDVDEEGIVTYVHHDYIHGIVTARMYPPNPSDRSRNSPMRMASLGPTPDGRFTSGDLYRDAGRAWELAQ